MQQNGVPASGEFLLLIANHQSALYAAVVALLGSPVGAQDVLQETNAALLRKASEYDPSRPFMPWAVGFARAEVMAWRKRQRRDRLVFDDVLFASVADRLTESLSTRSPRLDALEECLSQLPSHSRGMIEARYAKGESVQDMAARLQRSVNVVSVTLFRIRQTLLDCIQGVLAVSEEC